tara:strand:- start:1439 stop:1702 length:264 start_codon:yes stop_codon:yes gene_type:complete
MNEEEVLMALTKAVKTVLSGQSEVNEKFVEFTTESSEVSELMARRIRRLDESMGEIENDVNELMRQVNVLIDNLARKLDCPVVELKY